MLEPLLSIGGGRLALAFADGSVRITVDPLNGSERKTHYEITLTPLKPFELAGM